MAKGDSIEVMVGTPDGSRAFTIAASKAGRVVQQATKTRAKVLWLDIDEMTRTGRKTGNSLSFRMDAVIAVRQVTQDVPEPKAKPKVTRASAAAAGRAFEAMGRHEAPSEPLDLGQ